MRRIGDGGTNSSVNPNPGQFATADKPAAQVDTFPDDPPEWGLDPATLTPQQAFDAICQPELVARYTQGDCHLLAHAVAQSNGWGMVIVGDVYFEPDFCDDSCPAGCENPEHGSWQVDNLFHAWARRPDGRLVDIRGVHEPVAADRLAETWGTPPRTYESAAEADRVWDHAQWATGDEDIEDADYVASYVARFGAEMEPDPAADDHEGETPPRCGWCGRHKLVSEPKDCPDCETEADQRWRLENTWFRD